MRSFARILSQAEIELVAGFVLKEFAACEKPNSFYHTAANGWSDHEERYGAAYPFVRGKDSTAAAAGALTARQRRGLALYREACVICHDQAAREPVAKAPVGSQTLKFIGAGLAPPDPQVIKSGAEAPGNEDHDDHEEHGDHDDDEYSRGGPHDQIPVIPNLSVEELRGRDLYQKACADCHAADGTGENWVGYFLQPHPPDFTNSETWRSLSEARFKTATLEGLTNTSMPAFAAVLSDNEIDAILSYVKRAFVCP